MYVPAMFAFVVAAVLGLTMAVAHVRGVESGRAVGLTHGLFAVSGLVLLTVGLVQMGTAWWLLVAFGATALGGLYLFSRQARGERWPSAVVAIHGAAALASIALLVGWIVAQSDDIRPIAPTPEEQREGAGRPMAPEPRTPSVSPPFTP